MGGMGSPDPSTYSSGAGYGMAVNGDGDSQFARVFDQSGVDGKFQSNSSVGVQGQNLGPSQPSVVDPSKMSGGKRYRSKKNKKGGFLAGIINQAVVPLTLLGLNQKAKSMKKR